MEIPELKSFGLLQKLQEKKTLRGLVYQGFDVFLTILIIFNICIILGSMYILYKVSSEDFANVSTEGGVLYEEMDEKGLVKVVEVLETKQTNFEKIKNGSVKIFDPSL